MIFDDEQLGNLLAPLEPEWKARTRAELPLMEIRSHAHAWECISGMECIKKTKGNAK